jgi:hypothetical protein
VARNGKAPPLAGGRASNDQRPGGSNPSITLTALRAQFLIAAHSVRPELAAMVAAAAFGAGAHG